MPEPRLPEPFDGQPVVKTTISLRQAGDGLSEALATDAITLHLGERVTAVIEARVAGVNVVPLDDDDPGGPVKVVYVLKATERATLADDEAVTSLLAAQQERNERAKGLARMVDADGELTEEAKATA